MSQPLFLIILLTTTTTALSYIIHPIPTPNYSYPHRKIFSLASFRDDSVLRINSPFNITFQGISYTSLYICSNSFITFQPTDPAYARIKFINKPKILISAMDYVMAGLEVWATDDNITIWYSGYDFQKATEKLQWVLTFYKGDFEKFDLTVVRKTGAAGISAVCTAVNCRWEFGVGVGGGFVGGSLRFVDCGSGFCYDSGKCVKTNLQNCETCTQQSNTSTTQTCNSCKYGFSTTSPSPITCLTCSPSFLFTNNTCLQTPQRCLQLSPSSTTSCLACINNLSGKNCDICKPGYYFSTQYECSQCRMANCRNCSSEVCFQCFEGYELTLASECKAGNQNKAMSAQSNLVLFICAGVGSALMFIVMGVTALYCYHRHQRMVIDNMANTNQQPQNPSNPASPSPMIHIITLPFNDSDSKVALHLTDQQTLYKNQLQMCSICLQFNSNLMTNCSHYFHRKCLMLWFQKDRSCPNCKLPPERFYRGCVGCRRFVVEVGLGLGGGERRRRRGGGELEGSVCKECLGLEGKGHEEVVVEVS